MRHALILASLLVASAPSWALAHGGGYATPPGGAGGPQAAPGFGEPPADPRVGHVETRWETWWTDNREDLLKIAERVDSGKGLVATPGAGDSVAPPDAARTRAAIAAQSRWSILPRLLVALEDQTDFDVRCSAAIALGKLGDRRAASALETASRHDTRGEVRRSALLALGLLGIPGELPFLCDVVADREREFDERSMAALGVGLLGGDDAAEFLAYAADRAGAKNEEKKGHDNRQFLGTIYVALGLTGSIEALLPLWRVADDESAESFFRAHAVLSLGRLRDRESVGRFLKLLAPGNDVELRRCAATALGRVVRGTDVAAVRALGTALDSEKDLATRRFATASLGQARCAAARDLLRARLQSSAESSPDRGFLALALALQGDVASAPTIRDELKSERDESVRSALSMALGLLGDRDGISALEAQIGPGPIPGTYRGFAALSLAIIPSPGSRDVLWKRLPAESDARVRGDYAVALGLLGDPRAQAYLVDELKNGSGVFARCTAAACLGTLRRADAIPELVAIAENPRIEGVVRALCVVALGQIGDPSLVPKLSRLSAGGDSTFATKALAEALTIL